MSERRQQTTMRKYDLAGTGGLKAGAPPGQLVLVVDDDADITRFVSAVLGTREIRTAAAYDAIQGFLVAQREQPSLVLVDWHMPAGGGSQLLRKLRDNPRTSAIPVYVITADAPDSLPLEAQVLGARGVLLKPLDPDSLLALMKTLAG